MKYWGLVDSLIWASFFSKPDSPEKKAVDELIDSDRVALVGPIVAEVLIGFRRQEQADWVGSRLRAAHYVDLRWDDWASASQLGRNLVAKDHRIPLTDLVIMAVSRRLDIAVYSTDPHFDVVPDLKRYWPNK